MKLIAVTSQKGGTGKSTTALHLAGSLAAERKKVHFIDLDIMATATQVHSLSDNPLFTLSQEQPRETLRNLDNLTGFDYVFLDLPRFTGLNDANLAGLLSRVDFALVPFKPSIFDVLAAVSYLEAITDYSNKHNGKPKIAAFICQDEPRTIDSRDGRAILEESPYHIFKNSVPRLKVLDYADPGRPVIKQPYADRFAPFYKEFKNWIR